MFHVAEKPSGDSGLGKSKGSRTAKATVGPFSIFFSPRFFLFFLPSPRRWRASTQSRRIVPLGLAAVSLCFVSERVMIAD